MTRQGAWMRGSLVVAALLAATVLGACHNACQDVCVRMKEYAEEDCGIQVPDADPGRFFEVPTGLPPAGPVERCSPLFPSSARSEGPSRAPSGARAGHARPAGPNAVGGRGGWAPDPLRTTRPELARHRRAPAGTFTAANVPATSQFGPNTNLNSGGPKKTSGKKPTDPTAARPTADFTRNGRTCRGCSRASLAIRMYKISARLFTAKATGRSSVRRIRKYCPMAAAPNNMPNTEIWTTIATASMISAGVSTKGNYRKRQSDSRTSDH